MDSVSDPKLKAPASGATKRTILLPIPLIRTGPILYEVSTKPVEDDRYEAFLDDDDDYEKGTMRTKKFGKKNLPV